jgi:hypothetical protein
MSARFSEGKCFALRIWARRCLFLVMTADATRFPKLAHGKGFTRRVVRCTGVFPISRSGRGTDPGRSGGTARRCRNTNGPGAAKRMMPDMEGGEWGCKAGIASIRWQALHRAAGRKNGRRKFFDYLPVRQQDGSSVRSRRLKSLFFPAGRPRFLAREKQNLQETGLACGNGLLGGIGSGLLGSESD